MGHSSSIAMGIALAKPSKTVYCFDGDGAFLMHMGAAAQIGQRNIHNFKHILLNNGSHDSVGGQPTVGFGVDFVEIAKACGYKYAISVSTKEELEEAFPRFAASEGPAFFEIKLSRKTRNRSRKAKG